jgi:RIO kinase 1
MPFAPDPAHSAPHAPPDHFTLDYQVLDDPPDGEAVRWSTWLEVDPLCRGPEPRPDWIVTSQAAIDTDLGILKTGKEADAHLLERAVPNSSDPHDSVTMVAKRYRGEENRNFHRSGRYTEGRKVKRSRDTRALAKKSEYGRLLAAGQWARSEWDALVQLWKLGLSVPYPVQIDNTEVLMEWVTYRGETAPRLVQSRPNQDLLASYFEQLRDALIIMAQAGLVHGDLSPYNILAAGEQLVLIDFPQVVDLVANPSGLDFLLRDCRNMSTWFQARGLEVDADALFAEVIAASL